MRERDVFRSMQYILYVLMCPNEHRHFMVYIKVSLEKDVKVYICHVANLVQSSYSALLIPAAGSRRNLERGICGVARPQVCPNNELLCFSLRGDSISKAGRSN